MSLSEKIAELKQNLLTSINSLKTILQEKGVTVSDDDTLTTLIQKVETIQVGVGDEEIDQLILDYGYGNSMSLLEDVPSKALQLAKDALATSYSVTSTLDKGYTTVMDNADKAAIIALPDLNSYNNTSVKLLDCKNLKYIPPIDLSKVNSLFKFVGGCRSLEELNIINFDFSQLSMNGSPYYSAFNSCWKLKKITGLNGVPPVGSAVGAMWAGDYVLDIPYIDTRNCTDMDQYFPKGSQATQETFPPVNFEGVTKDQIMLTQNETEYHRIFAKNMSFEGTIYKDIKMYSHSLTRESYIDLFEHLADYSSGEAHNCIIGSTALGKLTDEDKAIAINKNWTLS